MYIFFKKFAYLFLLFFSYLPFTNSATAEIKAHVITHKNRLYAGEEIKYIDGFPNIIKFIKGDVDKPLIIFIPGNAHLARIAYGFPEGEQKAFLSYWFHKEGYSFLAISYPSGNAIYKSKYPAYTIQEWAKSIMNIAKEIINKNNLSKEIVLLAWSMSGELAQSINVHAKQNKLHIQLFAGLSAVAPLYNLIPDKFFETLKPDASGLANMMQYSDFLLSVLKEQNKINGNITIPSEIYLSEFIGNTPINIMGTAFRYKNGKFTYNLLEAINDSGAARINNYPPIAIIHGDLTKDLGFTIFGRYDWGSVISRYYYNFLQQCANNDPHKIKNGINLIKARMELFEIEVKGTHYFFVGEQGAKQSTEAVMKLIQHHKNITDQIRDICAK